MTDTITKDFRQRLTDNANDFDQIVSEILAENEALIADKRQILSWCGSLEEAKLNGEFEHKPEDSYFLKQVKTICQLAMMDIKG